MKSVRAATRPCTIALISVTAMALLTDCGQSVASEHSGTPPSGGLPRGVMSAAAACRLIVKRASPGFFKDPERVHLVLTTYAKGEPIESEGELSSGMRPRTLVWVVEVHAKAIQWSHSGPPGSQPARPGTDYSVVLNARTGAVSDAGECSCWPLPLWKVGTTVSLPPDC